MSGVNGTITHEEHILSLLHSLALAESQAARLEKMPDGELPDEDGDNVWPVIRSEAGHITWLAGLMRTSLLAQCPLEMRQKAC